MNATNEFKAALIKYVNLVQQMNKDYTQKHYPNNAPTMITIDVGTRYVRVVKNYGISRSVHSFVDITNGNILKGSWKAPVKNGVRGNIFNENISEVINHHGPNYLR